eukprot:scaffold4904_cov77-Skeletonema_marinoi.AAC.3
MNQDMMSAKLPSEASYDSFGRGWWMVDGWPPSVPPKQRGTQPAASRTPALEEHLRGQPTDHISFPATTSNKQQAMVHACR